MKRLNAVLLVGALATALVVGPGAARLATTAARWWRRAPAPVLGALDTTATPLVAEHPATPVRRGDDVVAVQAWVGADDVRALAWDGAHRRLWAATAGGLLTLAVPRANAGGCVAAGAPRPAEVNRQLPSLALHDVRPGPDGALWVASEAGVVRVDGQGAGVMAAGLASPRVVALAHYAGRLWAGTADGGLHRLEGDRFVPVALGRRGPREITALLAADALWVGTPEGVWRIAGGSPVRVSGAWVTDLADTSEGILATGPEGTWRLDGPAHAQPVGPAGWRLVEPGRAPLVATLTGGLRTLQATSEPGPALGTVRDAVATGGAVWWATDAGLVVTDAAGHLHRLGGTGLSDPNLTSVAVVAGRPVVGSWEGGLSVLEGSAFRPLGPGVDHVNQVLPAWDGADPAVWAATPHGLYRVGLEDVSILRLGRDEGLASDHVTALARAADGALWAATAGGLSRVRREHGGFAVDTFDRRHGLPDAPLQSVAVTADGAVVAGSLQGLVRLEGGRAQVTGPGDGRLPDGWVTALAAAGDALWIGTYDAGLVHRTGDAWRRLSPDPGGPGNRVHPGALVVDGARLLVGTQGAGLWVRGADGALSRYGRAQGLPSDEVTAVAVDGPHLWVATRGGLARLTLDPGGAA